MRLGQRKILYIRKSRESKKKFFAFFVFVGLIITVTVLVSYFMETLRPIMIELAKNEARVIANNAVNDAIISEVSQSGVGVGDFYAFEKDENGKILAVKYNLEGVNLLKAKLTSKIQENIEKTNFAKVSLPLGTILGTDILAGVGPAFNVEFVPYGIAHIDFLSDFKEAGINQTRLTINLSVKTRIGLIMPTAKAKIDVSQDLPVLQTLIVGDVPESYTNIDREGLDYEGDVMDIIN